MYEIKTLIYLNLYIVYIISRMCTYIIWLKLIYNSRNSFKKLS